MGWAGLQLGRVTPHSSRFSFAVWCRAVKNTSFRCYTIAGAAALFVGLAGNVQAIPISTLDDSTAGIWGRVQSHFDTAHLLDRIHGNQFSVRPNSFLFFRSALTENAGGRWGFGPARFHHEVFGGSIIATVATVPADSPAGVPDGASTALLVGLACGGLVLWPRRLKA